MNGAPPRSGGLKSGARRLKLCSTAIKISFRSISASVFQSVGHRYLWPLVVVPGLGPSASVVSSGDGQLVGCAFRGKAVMCNLEVAYMANDRIEKQIDLKAPVSRVWRALTDY